MRKREARAVVKRAAKLAGGWASLARELRIPSRQAVFAWDKIPAERVLDIEEITGISRHEQRPDVFGPEPVAAE